MAWTFECPCGQQRGWLLTKPTGDGFDCDDCGRPRADGKWVEFDAGIKGFVGDLLPEITPHFNISFGEQVRSRKHLEHLQAVHGFSDYSRSASKGPPTHWK